MRARGEKLLFPGSQGQELAGRLDRPSGTSRGQVLFAHCFSCSMDSLAAARISRTLTERGLSVFRFDFTGLGSSDGDVANAGFAGNVADLIAAADHLRRGGRAPTLLVGHSLGGAAVLAAAPQIPEARAVATVAAPSRREHVERLFHPVAQRIERSGRAQVQLAGRTFSIDEQLLEQLSAFDFASGLALGGRAALFVHSAADEFVAVDSARELFEAADHPKSFVGLKDANHLLSRAEDASYVARLIAAWAEPWLDAPQPAAEHEAVLVEEAATGRYKQHVQAGPHGFYVDEPANLGGDDAGPDPYELLLASLGACTSITLRMYAERKQLPLADVRVWLRHRRSHARDCAECETKVGYIDEISREIELVGDLSDAQRQRLLEIAEKCPVHRTLHSEVRIHTQLSDRRRLV